MRDRDFCEGGEGTLPSSSGLYRDLGSGTRAAGVVAKSGLPLSPMSPGQAEAVAQQAEVEGHLRRQVLELERDLARVTGERNIMREIKERFEADATAAQGERNEQRAEAERLLAQGKFLEERLASVQQDLEAAKVIENAQRDLNIAFVNELAFIFDRLGIDTRDVLEAALCSNWSLRFLMAEDTSTFPAIRAIVLSVALTIGTVSSVGSLIFGNILCLRIFCVPVVGKLSRNNIHPGALKYANFA